MTLIHLRVSDSATQKAIPVRIRISDIDGNSYAPLGRQENFPPIAHHAVGGQVILGEKKYYYIDGACEIDLQPGFYNFEVFKGERFHGFCKSVEIKQGQAALRIIIEKKSNSIWSDLISGDARCHGLSWAASVLEGAAEGLDIVHSLAREVKIPGSGISDSTDILDFSGQEVAYEKFGCTLFVNTLNHNFFLGAISIIHSHRPVFPLSSNLTDSSNLWSVIDWCRQGHRKNGLVTWVFDPANEFQGEALAALVLKEIDLVEISSLSLGENSQILFWYRLLDAGLKVNSVGASGKENNNVLLGHPKTWCKNSREIGALLHLTWLESVRKGDSFFSNGPFIDIQIENKGSSGKISLVAIDVLPTDHIELVINGEIIPVKRDENRDQIQTEIELDLTNYQWICARIISSENGKILVRAHTNPRFNIVKSNNSMQNQRKFVAIKGLLPHFENTEAWLNSPKIKDQKRVPQILGSIAEAKAILASGN